MEAYFLNSRVRAIQFYADLHHSATGAAAGRKNIITQRTLQIN
jgi:hypothetical protein